MAERSMKCSKCGTTFFSGSQLLHHNIRKHQGHTPEQVDVILHRYGFRPMSKLRNKLKDCSKCKKGKLWLQSGNQYGCKYECDYCYKITELPTNDQILRGISK